MRYPLARSVLGWRLPFSSPFLLMQHTSLPWWVGNTPGGTPEVCLYYTVLIMQPQPISSTTLPQPLSLSHVIQHVYVLLAVLELPWQKVSLLTDTNTFGKCKVNCGVSVCGYSSSDRMLRVFSVASLYMYLSASVYSRTLFLLYFGFI